MWAVRLREPGRVEPVDLPDSKPGLSEGQVLLRLRAVGLCGSDMPMYKGTRRLPGSEGDGLAPVHEVVGDVAESASSELAPGQRVVGTLGRHGGLAQFVVASASMLMTVPDGLGDVEAVLVQPLATVLRACKKFPPFRGQRTAVIGVGPIGLAFCHVLRHRGVGHLSAVDPVDRAQVAKSYGADEFFQMTSGDWLKRLGAGQYPHVAVEAAGHQQATLRDAVHAVCDHGFVFGFGEPDDAEYVLPYEELYMKDVTLAAGRTIEWPGALKAGAEYLRKHGADFAGYVSHVLPIAEAQQAYSLYAKPQVGRLKVVLVPSEWS
jgi:L-iditol 2-dehydrogenase